MKTSQDIIKTFTVGENSSEKDILLRENSNFVYGLPLLRHNIDNHEEKEFLYNEIYTKELVRLADEGVIYIHDKQLAPYCNSISCLTVATIGVPTIAKNMISSKPTSKINTFFRQISNLVVLISQQSSGACMISQFTTVLAGYIYSMKKTGSDISEDDLTEMWYNLIWELNLPLRSGSQSSFSNITLEFGKPSDEVKDQYIVVGGKSLDEKYSEIPAEIFDLVNRCFIAAMAKGTGKIPFTFPLITAPITDDFDFSNETFHLLLKEMYRWNGIYLENFTAEAFKESKYSKLNPMIKPRDPEVSRSLCCFTESEKVMIKEDGKIKTLSMKEISEGKICLLHNGKEWVEGKKIELPNRKMYKVRTSNGLETIMSDNHINPTLNGEKFTKDLTVSDYLPFNEYKITYSASNEDDYILGKLIGVLAGDGNLEENQIRICLNYTTKSHLVDEFKDYLSKYNLHFSESVSCSGIKKTKTPIYNIVKDDRAKDTGNLRNLFFENIKKYISFKNAHEKEFLDECLSASDELKQGIIDGYYETDGGDSNRIYSVNKKLIESFGRILSTMGVTYNISVDNRKKTDGGKLSDNPIYCIRPYSKFHKKYKDVFVRKGEFAYFRITDIAEYDYNENIHSFEMNNQNIPYFMLANGLFTHNCRLQLDLQLLSEVGGGIFGSSSGNTGAVGVNNINMNRILIDYKYKHNLNIDKLKEDLAYVMEVLQENHQRKREWIIKNKELYPTFFAFNKDLKNYFNVFAVSAMHEGLINIGFKDGMKDEEGKKLAHIIMQYLHGIIKSFIKRDKVAAGLEFAPNEGAGVTLARKDLEYAKTLGIDIFVQGNKETGEVYTTSGCMVPFSDEDFYSQIENASEFQSYATSGSILHQFLEEQVSPESLSKYIKQLFRKPIIYTTLSPTSTSCMSCGHNILAGDAKDIGTCPSCGSDDLATFSRVIGYSKMISRKGIKVNEYGKYEGEYNFWSNSRRIDWASRKKIKEETIDEVSKKFNQE